MTDLATAFGRHEEAIRRAVEARSGERLRNLRSTLEARRNQEVEAIGTVLDDLAVAIRNELLREPPLQYELWPENERTQLRRDVEALEQRLARIPEEKEREVADIGRRYEDFAARTFPVAVIFLVPESMKTGGVA
jgi:hypothetical protein